MAWYMYVLQTNILIVVLMWKWFTHCTTFKMRALTCLLMVFSSWVVVKNYLLLIHGWEHPGLQYFFDLIFIGWMYRQYKQRDFISVSEVNNIHWYYLVKKPKNTLGLIISLFWLPAQSLAIYGNGWLYRFDSKKSQLVKEKRSGKSFDGFTIIKTKKVITDRTKSDLDGLIGTEWEIQHNCFSVLKQFGPLKDYLHESKC